MALWCLSPAKAVTGQAQWEEAIRGILSIKGKMTIKTVYCYEAGDVRVGAFRVEHCRRKRCKDQR